MPGFPQRILLSRLFFVLVALLGMVSSYNADAQELFAPGYMLDKNSVRVWGLIEKRNPTIGLGFWFQPNAQAAPVNFTPSTSKGYGYDNGDEFVTRKVLTGSDSVEVFLKILETGKVSVLEFGHRYFVSKDGSLTELKPLTFIDQLKNILAECERTVRFLNHNRNSKGDALGIIRKAVTGSNDCRPLAKPESSWFISGGYHLLSGSFLKSTSSDLAFYSSNKFVSDARINFGVDMQVMIPRMTRSAAMTIGLRYLPISGKTSVLDAKEYNEVSFSSQSVLIPIGLKLMPLEHNGSSLYFPMKVAPSILLSQSASRLREVITPTDVYPSTSTFTRKAWLVAMAGIGYSRKIGELNLFGEINVLHAGSSVTFSESPNEESKQNFNGLLFSIGVKIK